MRAQSRIRHVTNKPSLTTAIGLAIILVFVLTVSSQSAAAQALQVLHSFSFGPNGIQNGTWPLAGLTMDKAGNLYGTTSRGGHLPGQGICDPAWGCGTVFRLSPNGTFTVLYRFNGPDGFGPVSRVIFGPDGTLYGTTMYGGDLSCNRYANNGNTPGCGVVFNLKPPPSRCPRGGAPCGWTVTVLHQFTGTDGANPGYGDLVFDPAGNIYGTTVNGGELINCFVGDGLGCGVVFKLTPSTKGWTESVLYSFQQAYSGTEPYGGVVFDNAGNLWGTTMFGGSAGSCATGFCGTIFELTSSTNGWIYSYHPFTGGADGANPASGLTFDGNGNLYGSTVWGGIPYCDGWDPSGCGVIFKVTTNWAISVIYTFPSNPSFPDGPYGSLTLDAAGNLYGTTLQDGACGRGSVFQLTPGTNGWTFNSLHDFCSTGWTDGALLYGSVTVDANGNLYGTTSRGGTVNQGEQGGTVWKITP